MFSVKVHAMEMEEGEGLESSAGKEVCVETVKFSSGNPRVETTRGEMHLFRAALGGPGAPGELPAGRNEQLCVLAVPRHMTGADFCQYTGSFFQSITEIRIVRNDAGKDRYSVLMKFETQASADEFFQHFNGKPFSSLESEICHVLFVADVQYTSSGEQASAAPSGLTELPTCPVCLERLDEHVSGILTTVCNHSFHSSCISKWTDSSCPVCRYCQQKYEDSTCSVCSTEENLWMCLICGFVGCGRYQEGHAVMHWRETQHCYCLDLETQDVWDYAGDNYVHRLVQSKTDGKLVELNHPCHDSGSCECSRVSDYQEAISLSKLEAAKLEYEHSLTSLMETQREYYDGLLAEAKRKEHLEIERAVSKKLQKMNEKICKAEEEKTFLEEINERLRKNQDDWKVKYQGMVERQTQLLKEKDGKIADLEEQVRDLMVFIEAQKTLAKNTDLLEGTAVVGPQAEKARKIGRRRK